MKKKALNTILVFLALTLFLLPNINVFGQEMESGRNSEGYGSYDRMGQDPDAIIKYGRDMMRYGFHEAGMQGGSNKYPGYYRNLPNKTIKELNMEQEAFIQATEKLRQTIYEKELYLKAELVKKEPDLSIALSFQNEISKARGAFEQIMIGHLIRMKKINSASE